MSAANFRDDIVKHFLESFVNNDNPFPINLVTAFIQNFLEMTYMGGLLIDKVVPEVETQRIREGLIKSSQRSAR